ncbi:MAG: hypothetical protein EXS23_00185, partial [Pedosphaera sp.]|nr:hypothetical protein [Pedosphaera sp.]
MLSKFIHIKTWLLAAALVWLIHSVATVEAADPVAKPVTTASAQADHAGTGDAAVPLIKQFAYSYLTAFMFYLSICLGALVLVLFHHLFDAGWSVPIRRFLEHIAFLLPVMGLLFLPIAFLATEIYPWMTMNPPDHSLTTKRVLFNQPTFYVVAFVIFLLWTWLTWNLRRWSIKQDATGDPKCTIILRRYAAGGIWIFALTLTFAAIYWMKSLQHQFFSTMYGVYYFAGSTWTMLATCYLITIALSKGPLKGVIFKRQIYDIGVLLFAFTVFYAYIHFSQYFLIWNAAIPEETFWYVLREKGSWWDVGMVILFGHFLVPFVTLLRIDVKLNLSIMFPVCVWVWLMHYLD